MKKSTVHFRSCLLDAKGASDKVREKGSYSKELYSSFKRRIITSTNNPWYASGKAWVFELLLLRIAGTKQCLKELFGCLYKLQLGPLYANWKEEVSKTKAADNANGWQQLVDYYWFHPAHIENVPSGIHRFYFLWYDYALQQHFSLEFYYSCSRDREEMQFNNCLSRITPYLLCHTLLMAWLPSSWRTTTLLSWVQFSADKRLLSIQ